MSKPLDREKVALQWRRTKIIATLGPASNSRPIIEKLMGAGVDLVRLNMSHGDHDSHRLLVQNVRQAAQQSGKHAAIIMDLSGPKIRVGRFRDGEIGLKRGGSVTLTTRPITGKPGLIPSQYRGLHKDVKRGDRILLDDGNLELAVESIKGVDIRCRVTYGGSLKDNKGMNLPDSSVSVPAFTDKDRQDAALAIELGTDYLALSFVRSGKDVTRLARFLKKHDSTIPIISKIERAEAVANIDEILRCSQGIMVARGDLGIELPAERVPIIQSDLINRARRHNLPVIVATQMLDSMIERSRPTRAEVGDVANAAIAGADGVMLSGETASGKYPLKAVQTMDRVLREIEAHQWRRGSFGELVQFHGVESEVSVRAAVAHAALSLSKHLQLQAIVIPTQSGTTVRHIAAERPIAPSVGVCSDPVVCRRLALNWGVVPVVIPEAEVQDWRRLCKAIAEECNCNLTRRGHTVLLVSGFSDDSNLSEPVLKILRI